MNGLRASSLVTERMCWVDVMEGEKATAEPARREAMANFMVLTRRLLAKRWKMGTDDLDDLHQRKDREIPKDTSLEPSKIP